MALAVGGIVGLSSGVVAGRFADRRGPRGLYVATMTAESLAMLSLFWASSFGYFVIAIALASLTMTAGLAARAPLVRAHAGDTPTQFRAFLRTVTGLGIGVGSVIAAGLVALDSPVGYATIIIANALSFLACAVLLLWLPAVPPIAPVDNSSASESSFLGVLGDVRFVVFCLAAGVLSVNLVMLPFALPLWISQSTSAPSWAIGVLMFLNAVGGVVFQIRASRSAGSLHGASRTLVWAAVALGSAYTLFALSSVTNTAWALLILLLACGALTAGELWHSAGTTEMIFRMPPARKLGEYQGFFGTVQALLLALSPAALTWVVLGSGPIGWLLLAALTGGAAIAIVLLGERRAGATSG
jgi:hypothetical protein